MAPSSWIAIFTERTCKFSAGSAEGCWDISQYGSASARELLNLRPHKLHGFELATMVGREFPKECLCAEVAGTGLGNPEQSISKQTNLGSVW